MEEKTEKPTPKKLRDARKKGQVAQSKEVVSTALVTLVLFYFWARSEFYIEQFMALIALPAQFYLLPFDQALELVVDKMMDKMVILMLPLIALVVLVIVASSMIQFGVLFVAEPIKPELKKINPIEGFKKIFSMNNLAEFIKSTVKIVLLSLLIYWVVLDNLADIVKVSYCGTGCVLPVLGHLFKFITIITVASFIVIAAADFFFQKKQHIKQLKMSKDEVKREYKQTEGDPEIRGKRKQFFQELVSTNVPKRVQQSTVIVTNPTHVAVGLFYDSNNNRLPNITIIGCDFMAKHIRQIAQQERIPVVEHVPLARSLLADGEMDSPIPIDLIEPVAEVLKWVSSLDQPTV